MAVAAQLRVEAQRGRSYVIAAQSESPLRLLTPRNHGHAAWVYQSSYGGGLVGRDDVQLDVRVEEHGALFLSSQSSSKVYAGADARFGLRARVGADATLIVWPDPLVCFAGARFTQQLRFALEPTGNLLCVDAYGAGRVAYGERWAFEQLALSLHVDVGDAPVLRDALVLSAQHGALVERMAAHDAFATVILAGPKLADAGRALHASICSAAASETYASSLWPWGTIVRLGAPSVPALVATLHTLLDAYVGELLGDDPFLRKW